MKTTLTKKIYSFILLICGMFFITGSNVLAQCGPCSNNNKVRITKYTYYGYYEYSCKTKCVEQEQLQKYYDQGWVLGSGCPGHGCGGNQVASSKANIEATSLFIYSNPVSNSTTISISLEQSEKVSLQVFDMAARLVKLLADKVFEKGEQQLEWNTNNVEAGVYFVKMETPGYSENKKLIVVK